MSADGLADATPAEIETEIRRTRAQLADTVDELVGTFDVKSRARDAAAKKVADVRTTLTGAADSVRATGERLAGDAHARGVDPSGLRDRLRGREPVLAGVAAAVVAVAIVVAVGRRA